MTSARSSRRVLPSSPFRPAASTQPVERFEVDDRVTHDRHGLGTVVGANGSEVTVDFGSAVRRIALPSSKLTKL